MESNLRKIISGGQTGADQGGLLAAREANYQTGGWLPKGWMTETGPRPDLADFGCHVIDSNDYVARTQANVSDSDGTIRFANDFNTAGERATLGAIKKQGKPFFDVDIRNPASVDEVANWICEEEIEILNIAGNRESVAPGTMFFVKFYLLQVFKKLAQDELHCEADDT